MASQFWDEPKHGKEMTAAELIGFVDEFRGSVRPDAKIRVRVTMGGGIKRIEVDERRPVQPITAKPDAAP
jgi:hypothetical protein